MDPISTKIALGAAGAGGGGSYWILSMGNTISNDTAYSVTTDSSNNIIFAAQKSQGGYGWNVKLDTDGVVQWEKGVDDTYNMSSRGIVCDSADNIYTVGYSANTASTYNGGNLYKRDSSGNLVWQRLLENSVNGNEEFTSIAIDSSDNVYICGHEYNGTQYSLHYAKYNSNGVIQVQRQLRDTGGNRTEGQGISVDPSGNVYTLGSWYNGSDYYLLIAQHNSSYTNVWQRSIGGQSSSRGYHQVVDSSGNTYNLGRINNGSGNHIFIAKYNSSGTVQWQRTLGGAPGTTYTATPGEIVLDSAGNVYCSGYHNVAGNNRAVLAKYNNSGVLQWQRYLQGPSTTELNGITLDSDNNIIGVGGYYNAPSNDVFALKVPNDGSLTGTYGNWTYGVETLTDASVNYTSNTQSLSNLTTALGDSATSFTDVTTTEPSSITTL